MIINKLVKPESGFQKSSGRSSKIFIFSIFNVFKYQIGVSKKIEADIIQFLAMLNSTLLYSILAEVERILVLIVIYLSFDNCTVSSFTI